MVDRAWDQPLREIEHHTQRQRFKKWDRSFWDLEASTHPWDRFRRLLHQRVFPKTLYRIPRWGRSLERRMYRHLYGDPFGIRKMGQLVRECLESIEQS